MAMIPVPSLSIGAVHKLRHAEEGGEGGGVSAV